jgi:hypothetical protein
MPDGLIRPWPKEKRGRIQAKIDKEAKRTAVKLGARCCVIVAFFEEGAYYHMQDGGQSPVPTEQLYRQLVSMKEVLEASGGEDVQLQ